jgi:hypothetical protein
MAYSCRSATTGQVVLALLVAACGSKAATPAPTTPAPTMTPATTPTPTPTLAPTPAPVGPPSYAVEVTAADPAYAPTATVSTDDAVHAGVAAVMHIDVRFPTTPPGSLTDGYTGFAIGHPGPVTFTAPDGVVIDPSKIKLRDPAVTATHENVAFDARVTAPTAGATPISADIKFALCDRQRCDVRTATLRWSIDVQP